MKRRAALASSQQRPAKRQKSQLAVTQEIVRKELRKNTDWRYTDYASNGGPIYDTGAITSVLGNLSRGDSGLNSFQGNYVKPQGLLFKYYLETAQVYEICRVMIFQWFDATTPVLSGILQSTVSGLAPISATLVTNKPYIKVLHDKTYSLAPTAGGDTTVLGNGLIDPVTVYIPGKKLRQIRYASTTNTVQEGNIYVLAVSNDAALSTVNMTFYSRLTFADQ